MTESAPKVTQSSQIIITSLGVKDLCFWWIVPLNQLPLPVKPAADGLLAAPHRLLHCCITLGLSGGELKGLKTGSSWVNILLGTGREGSAPIQAAVCEGGGLNNVSLCVPADQPGCCSLDAFQTDETAAVWIIKRRKRSGRDVWGGGGGGSVL